MAAICFLIHSKSWHVSIDDPPRRAEISNHATEKLILIFISHFPAEVKHIHTTYLVNINVL
jgi:hypothetical protein